MTETLEVKKAQLALYQSQSSEDATGKPWLHTAANRDAPGSMLTPYCL